MDHSCILSIPLAPGICDKWLQNVLLSFFLTTRARRPALQHDCIETDGKDATKKKGMTKRAANGRRTLSKCSVVQHQEDWNHRSSYESVRVRPTKKSAQQKSLLTANCGAFSLRQNSKYSYVSPEPIRFYLRKRRQPETVQNSKPPLVRHVTVTSVGIKLKTQRGYRHRTCDTWRGEK